MRSPGVWISTGSICSEIDNALLWQKGQKLIDFEKRDNLEHCLQCEKRNDFIRIFTGLLVIDAKIVAPNL